MIDKNEEVALTIMDKLKNELGMSDTEIPREE